MTAPEPRDESAVAEVGLTEAEWTRLRHAAGNRGDLGPIAEEVERILAERVQAAAVEALRLVREVEREMSAQAFDAWRSADARRGLADHDALLAHADALTRWSERLRMAFDGQDYRADRRAER